MARRGVGVVERNIVHSITIRLQARNSRQQKTIIRRLAAHPRRISISPSTAVEAVAGIAGRGGRHTYRLSSIPKEGESRELVRKRLPRIEWSALFGIMKMKPMLLRKRI